VPTSLLLSCGICRCPTFVSLVFANLGVASPPSLHGYCFLAAASTVAVQWTEAARVISPWQLVYRAPQKERMDITMCYTTATLRGIQSTVEQNDVLELRALDARG
jgi:predicted GNAT family acetyltransferase